MAKAYNIRKDLEPDNLLQEIDLKEQVAKATASQENIALPSDPFAGEEAREQRELKSKGKSFFTEF